MKLGVRARVFALSLALVVVASGVGAWLIEAKLRREVPEQLERQGARQVDTAALAIERSGATTTEQFDAWRIPWAR